MRFKRLDSNILFESEHLAKDLAGKTVRGGVVTMTAQGAQFLIRTGSTVILARLLSPTDFGIVAMAMVMVGFLEMFKDAGLSVATIQQERITREQISTLFWINVIISLALGLVVLASAPVVGLFYKRAELVPLTAFLSVNFVLGGLTLQHQALLRRHMMFKALRSIAVGSQLVGLSASIVLAFYGYGYWSLVWGTLVTSIANIAQTWLYIDWIPGRMEKGRGIRKMLKFGWHLSAANLAHFLARYGDKLLIGKFLGADSLGIYDTAYRMYRQPIDQVRAPLTHVALPALSAIKGDPERYAKYHYHIFEMIALISFPISMYCLVEADFLIGLLLGAQWTAAIPIFRILAGSAIIIAVANTRGMVLLSHGLSGRYLTLAIVNAVLTIVSIAIGLPFGIIGVALSYLIFQCLFVIPSMLWCFKGTPLTLFGFFRAVSVPAMASIGSVLVFVPLKHMLSFDSLLFHVAFALSFFGVYVVLCYLNTRMRTTFWQIAEQILPFRSDYSIRRGPA